MAIEIEIVNFVNFVFDLLRLRCFKCIKRGQDPESIRVDQSSLKRGMYRDSQSILMEKQYCICFGVNFISHSFVAQ